VFTIHTTKTRQRAGATGGNSSFNAFIFPPLKSNRENVEKCHGVFEYFPELSHWSNHPLTRLIGLSTAGHGHMLIRRWKWSLASLPLVCGFPIFIA